MGRVESWRWAGAASGPFDARIDAPGAVHHLMVRGITRSAIFYDSVDRERFTNRAGIVFEDRTGITPLAGTMRLRPSER